MKTSDFSFDLDPYEQALEDELERLDSEGLLVVKKLTPEEKNMYQQTAANTLKLLREGKRWMVEHHSDTDSSEELMTWLSPAAQEKLKEKLKKQTIAPNNELAAV
ncbi:MAG TPA: hypothetical protein VJK54_00435 [Chthoniobacterales bacterium]|nr:hypothetical protein [Chthoniobacterales bacterium]